MHGAETQQLLTHTQIRHLTLTGGASNAIDMQGFNAITFLANVAAAGAIKIEVESSPDGTANWVAVKPNYLTTATQTYPIEGDATNTVKVEGSTTAVNQFVAVSLYGGGREYSIGSGVNRFIRAKVTGTAAYAIALLSQASWKPVAQPELGLAETKAAI